MTYTNPVKHETELVQRLWSQGWAAFRTASPGVDVLEDIDIIAFKGGEAYLLSMVLLKTGSSTKKVIDQDGHITYIMRRATSSTQMDSQNITAGYAIKKLYYDEWYFADGEQQQIKASNDYELLHEEMGK